MNSKRSASTWVVALIFSSGLALAQPPRLVEGTLASDLVPQAVEYYALLPPGYDALQEEIPLVFNLHGGGGSRDVLERLQPRFEGLWERGEIPPMVIVSPSVTPRSFYMDYRDGSEKWESFLIGPFLTHLRDRFRVRSDRRGTLTTGASMGGMGSLRLAFKHPDVFGAVAALEPGIAPIDDWQDMRPKHRFWRADRLMEQIYGKPVDREYWNANNPATLAQSRSQELRSAGLRIFLEAGDADMFWLYEGTEYLHQVLWDLKIRHEYRLYYDQDHVGRTLGPRTEAAFRFLASTLTDPEPDPRVEAARRRIDPLKRRLTEADHYDVDRALVAGPPKVIFETHLGNVEMEIYPARAPLSAANFLAYVDAGLYDGATFYRAVRAEHGGGDPSAIQVVQGGVLGASMSGGGSRSTDPPRPPIAHETTDRTGITNERGVLAYARLAPGTAGSEFFINMKDNPALDTGDARRQPDGQGYATFGRVVAGMDVLERIQAMPTKQDARLEMLRGQILEQPVTIRTARRVN